MLKPLSDIDFFKEHQRQLRLKPEVDPSRFVGREEWYFLSLHKAELSYLGVDTSRSELANAIAGYPNNVEGAILAFLEKFKQPNISASRKLALMIRNGSVPNHAIANTPRLPVRTSADFAPPLVPPTAVPQRSLSELQADLDKGGVVAMSVRVMLRHNPQWNLEIVDGKIQPLPVFEEVF